MKSKLTIIDFLLGSLGLISVAAAAPQLIPMTEQQRQSLGIQTAAPKQAAGFFGQNLPAQVVIPPTQLRLISAPQAGLVSQLMAAAGDTVKAGQPLAELQSPELATLQREYLQALTQERLAASELERDRTLYKEGIIAKRRYLETRSRYQELTAMLEEHRQTLLLAGLAPEDVEALRNNRRLSTALEVRSPIEGVVLERNVDTGERVEISAPLYRVARLDPLWLEVRAPLETASKLSPGDPFRVAGLPAKGQLISIGHDVDPASQTVRLRAEVTKGANQLKPGQYVEVAIGANGGDEQRYRVPSAAVARSGDQTLVFISTPEGFRPQPVQVLETADTEAVITGDIAVDAQIAVQGIAAIKGAWMGLGSE